MKTLIAIVILLAVLYWAFKAGKREGSVKGYGVGRRHERRRRTYRRR